MLSLRISLRRGFYIVEWLNSENPAEIEVHGVREVL